MKYVALINKTDDNIIDHIFEVDSFEDIEGLYDPEVYDLKFVLQDHDPKTLFEETDLKRKGLYCEPGWKWDSELERFYQWQPPGDDWTMTVDRYWKPPIDPEDGYIFPTIHPVSLKSRRWIWSEDDHRWEKKDDVQLKQSFELFGEFNK